MKNQSEFQESEFKIEPSFEFCWTLAWRLVLLSTGMALVPLVAFNLCIGILAATLPAIFFITALVVGNVLLVLLAFTLALKILLSKNFKNSFIRFYSSSV